MTDYNNENINDSFIPPPLPTEDKNFVPPPLPISDDFLPPPIPLKIDCTKPSSKRKGDIEHSDNKRLKNKKLMIIISVSVAFLICIAVIIPTVIIPSITQNQSAAEQPLNSVSSDYNDASSKIGINNTLISTLGLTYGELIGRYGVPMTSYWYEGGKFYAFNTKLGIISYAFENSYEYEPAYDEPASALRTTAGALFDNFGDGKTVSAINTALGITLNVEYDEENNDGSQIAIFDYKDTRIFIYMGNSQEFISTNAEVLIQSMETSY